MGGVEKNFKKHAAGTPVAEGGKKGESDGGREGGGERGPKSVHSVWEVCTKVKKTCSENAGSGGTEGGRGARWGGMDG